MEEMILYSHKKQPRTDSTERTLENGTVTGIEISLASEKQTQECCFIKTGCGP